MQTKSSYRVLKWTLLVGTAASLATACVVTSGDGAGGAGDSSFAGDGTSASSGKTSTGGTKTTAGTTSTGGSAGTSGSTSTAGTSMTQAGAGGAGAYVAGLCQVDDPTPTMLPSCDPNPERDKDQPCKICMKAKCCDAWQTCNGDTPTSACGWGATADAPGQFDCISDCYAKNEAGETDPAALLESCAGGCANQCDTSDNGNILDATNALISCANDPDPDKGCQTECFPFN